MGRHAQAPVAVTEREHDQRCAQYFCLNVSTVEHTWMSVRCANAWKDVPHEAIDAWAGEVQQVAND